MLWGVAPIPLLILLLHRETVAQFVWSTFLLVFFHLFTDFFNPLAVVPRLNRNTIFQIMSPPFQQWIIPLKVWQAEIPQIQPTFTTTKKQEGNSHQNYVVRRIKQRFKNVESVCLLNWNQLSHRACQSLTFEVLICRKVEPQNTWNHSDGVSYPLFRI